MNRLFWLAALASGFFGAATLAFTGSLTVGLGVFSGYMGCAVASALLVEATKRKRDE